MASSRRMALGLAWVVLVAGCGGSATGDAPDSKLARAERSLQAELEEAADHLGLAAEPGEVVSPTRCDAGKRQEVTSGYRIRLRLSGDQEQVLRQAARFWRRRGHRVRVLGRHGRFPAVFATADPGWTYGLQLFPDRGEALLSGGTPCLPDPQP
jgi:hypothetical protein